MEDEQEDLARMIREALYKKRQIENTSSDNVQTAKAFKHQLYRTSSSNSLLNIKPDAEPTLEDAIHINKKADASKVSIDV